MSFDALANLKRLASMNTPQKTATFISGGYNTGVSRTISGSSGGLFGTSPDIESGESTQRIINISADLERLNTGSKYAAQLPDITRAINENFASIAQTFGKLGATIEVKNPTGTGTTTIPTSKPTGLPGQGLTESLGGGFSQIGDFLKANPLILFGVLGIVALKVIR